MKNLGEKIMIAFHKNTLKLFKYLDLLHKLNIYKILAKEHQVVDF